MKKFAWLFIGILISIILYALLFFNIPRFEYSPVAKNQALAANMSFSDDYFKKLQHYKVTKDIIAQFEEKDILNYGKWDPTLFNVYIPPEPEPEPTEEDNAITEDLNSQNTAKAISFTQLPVDKTYYEISSPFGNRIDPFTNKQAFHNGIDISKTNENKENIIEGKNVYAVKAGVVELAEMSGDYGNLIIINHGDGLKTYYAHLNLFNVKIGDEIKPGDIIGTIGSTGRSTDAHLHFEVKQNDVSINPEPLLPN